MRTNNKQLSEELEQTWEQQKIYKNQEGFIEELQEKV